MPPKKKTPTVATAADHGTDDTKAEKTALLISKTGMVREIQVSVSQKSDLYKKAGLKTSDGFHEQFVWELALEEVKYSISLYGKKMAKTDRGPKNAYGFPPPLEEAAYAGSCLLVSQDGDLTTKLWDDLFEMIYEKYEGEEADDDEDEEDEADDVDEADEAEEEADDEEEEEPDDEEGGGPTTVRRKKRGGGKAKKAADDLLLFDNEVVEQFLDCSCELEYEPFV
jgi:hypothetical protein